MLKFLLPAILLSSCGNSPTQPERDLSIAGTWELNALGLYSIMVLEKSGDYVLFQTAGQTSTVRRGTWQTKNGKLRITVDRRGNTYNGEYHLDGDRLELYYPWYRVYVSSASPWADESVAPD